MAGDVQRERAAQRRQQQRAHVHERRHQPLVEQHQHREDQEGARDQGAQELGNELRLFPLVAGTGPLHAFGQVLQVGSCVEHRLASRRRPAARSAPIRTRRSWLMRWMIDGPGAEADVGDDAAAAPSRRCAVGTGMFSIVERLRRELSSSVTRIGTCRSESEKRALAWSISPWVATRIAWLIAWVVTPMSAIRSSRGRIMISGRLQVAGDARRAQLGPLPHFLDELQRGALQADRIGAGEQHRDVAAADLALVAEEHPRVRDRSAAAGATWRWNPCWCGRGLRPGPSARRRWWRCRRGRRRRPTRRRAGRAAPPRPARRPRASGRASRPAASRPRAETMSSSVFGWKV